MTDKDKWDYRRRYQKGRPEVTRKDDPPKPMPERKIGTALRVSPDVVRLDIPLPHADDLPQLARRLEQLAFELKAIHQNEQLNNNGKLADAYAACRALKRKLKQENPR